VARELGPLGEFELDCSVVDTMALRLEQDMSVAETLKYFRC
jgi:hypothetical protein